MADNVLIDPGTTPSVPVSTDDAGAAGHVQRVKLALSADGSAAHATVTADGVLVDLGTNNDVTVTSSALPSGAATAAKQPALGTAGSPSTDVISVQGVGSGTALPVSAASLPLPSGAATAANQTTIVGHVDGIEALLGTIDADTSTLAGAVAGTEMQVDVLTLPALPAGTNNIGDVDVLTLPARSHGWKAYTAAIASALTTELDALANGSASAASAAIDNTSTLDTHIDVTVTLATQGSARSAGATVVVYIIYALDGTNYDRAVAATAEPLVVLPYDAATTTTQSTRTGIIRPGLFKLIAVNNTGQALGATGNLVEYRTYKRGEA